MKIERWGSLLRWLMPMVVTTILFGTVYVVAQQVDRSQANDAPLRLASQVAAELSEGKTTTIDAQPRVDLARSLAPFVVVENAKGVATSGSGYLNDALVSLPPGVLSNAGKTGEDNVTWQPAPGLRFATVTLRSDGQFVSAGQSLAPSEDRVGNYQLLIGFGWLLSMVVIGGCWVWLGRVSAGLRRQFDARSRVPHSSE